MNQLELVIGKDELSKLDPGPFQDGHDEVRREIKQLLATIRAMVALLPPTE